MTGGTSLAEEGLREALAGLHGAGLLETLGERHSFAEAWSALQECLFADEIRQVHFSISKIKAKGSVSLCVFVVLFLFCPLYFLADRLTFIEIECMTRDKVDVLNSIHRAG